MSYHWDFSILWRCHAVLLEGILTTFKIVLALVALSILGKALLAPSRGASRAVIRLSTQGLIETMRSAPPLVLTVWAYYCLPILFGLTLSSYLTYVLAISLYGSVFFAEIFRSGMQSVDHGLVEAGLPVGMSSLTVLVRVTAPVVFLQILPAFISQCVMSVKSSVLVSYIATGEILYQGQRLNTATFRPLETLAFVALFFVATILPLSLLVSYTERRIRSRHFKRWVTMTISATRQLVNFASTLSAPAIPAPVRRRVRLHLLDALACGRAASGHWVSEPMIRASRLFDGNGHCSVFGESGFSPLAAASANTAMIDGLDHDGGVEIDGKGLGHLGATLIAAAMIAPDFNPEPVVHGVLVTTLAAGFEVNNRLIYAIQPSAERFSQVYGVAQHQSIGAAVAAGRLLGLNPEQLHRAVGLAAALTLLPSLHQHN